MKSMCQPLEKLLMLVTSLVLSHAATATPDTLSYPFWMRQAVIYGIKPSAFTVPAGYNGVRRKVPELKALGVNTIWLQPVFQTAHGGQGYDVTDFFSLRADLGTASELKALVATCKANGMRVLFDFVPNHTSIEHPFAADIIQNGRSSAYYEYYQHDNDGARYSSFYHKDPHGFIYYFWKDLVNLNYDNPRVQDMTINACKHWIQEFDIDGYRFDAVWAVNARAPLFGRRLRDELRSVKADVLLLAEDKGNAAEVYDHGFDAAYDWTNDTAWVSQWSWQYKHDPRKSYTLFDHPVAGRRKEMLRNSLFLNTANNFRVVRFLENNDLPRFIADHSLEQTKMAAALMFSMPGIPALFCGQEIGFKGHPYSRKIVFDAGRTIQQQDSFGLFDFYRRLIQQRLSHPSLTGSDIREIAVPSASVVAYRRGQGSEKIIVVANLDSLPEEIAIGSEFPKRRTRSFVDLVTGKAVQVVAGGRVQIAGNTTLWLIPVKRE